jgi:hypothetical protein
MEKTTMDWGWSPSTQGSLRFTLGCRRPALRAATQRDYSSESARERVIALNAVI